jgi:hypothetical protein
MLIVELVFAVAIFLLLVLLVVQLLAARGFRGRALQLAARVRAGHAASDNLDRLPKLVAEHVLRSGVKPGTTARSVSFTQVADLRLKPGTPFRTFAAFQVIGVGQSAFLWEARQTAGSMIGVRVIDAFIDGQGLIEARAMGTIPVVRSASRDISLAEAYRYLAELPWAPDAILGNPEIQWRELDGRRAEARLAGSFGEAVVAFDFDARGDIVAVQAKGRPATDPSGRSVRYDWVGKFGEYSQFGSRRVPGTAEVGYVYPAGYEVYFRGRIADYHVSA